MTHQTIYKVEYNYNGQKHGDVFVVLEDDPRSPEEQAVAWLKSQHDAEDAKFEILSYCPIDSLGDCAGGYYEIKHTISEYLKEVVEA
jgi:hypothetical protein